LPLNCVIFRETRQAQQIKYRRVLYVSPFYHCFVFLRVYCCADFLALSGGGRGGAEQHQSGGGALVNNTTGSFNTATGNSALFSNSTGSQNTANGVNALVFNTTGDLNTSSGVQALYRAGILMIAVQALEKRTAELKLKEAQIAGLESKVEDLTAKHA
jgi:hypothetical protein